MEFHATPLFVPIASTRHNRHSSNLAALHLLPPPISSARCEDVRLGFAPMHDGMFKQGVKSFDRLNRIVSLRHRHSLCATNKIYPSILPIVSHRPYHKGLALVISPLQHLQIRPFRRRLLILLRRFLNHRFLLSS